MTRKSPRGMSFEQVCALAARLPAVERATSYGPPVIEQLLEDAWRAAAPKRLLATYENMER